MVGSAPVSIDEVVRGVPERCEPRVYGDRDPTLAHIEHITHDSRQVRRGSLFACIPGAVNDGHTFARQAVSNGAVALLVDRPVDEDVPQLVVKSVRESLGWVAASVYRHPSRELTVVGVTGTNGKTTTTHMVTSIARAAGLSAEPIGTLSGARTTPEATDLQATLRQFVDDGVQLAAIEVSSHGLDQNRVDGMIFDASVFTNLTVDHLDYHQTMEAYFEAKALLFTGDRSRHMVVNSDDEYGRRLIASIGNHAMAYSLADADQLIGGPNGSTFVWRSRGQL